MSRFAVFSRSVYAGLVRLYPAEFRQAFGAELVDVFIARLCEAQQLCALAVARIWLRELIDLPGNLFTEYWLLVIKPKGEPPMSAAARSKLFLIGLALPLGMAVLLGLINPLYMFKLFSTGLGWLFVSSFCLLLVLNVLLAQLGPVQEFRHTGVIAASAFLALAFVILGPAYLTLFNSGLLENSLLKTIPIVILIVVDLLCLGGLAALLNRRRTA